MSAARATKASDNTLMFWCPGCDDAHGITVDESRGWKWNGSLEKPTTTPSILVRSGHYADGNKAECWCTYEERFGEAPPFKCTICHSYVTDGRIQFLSDCSHELAGQTVDLPVWEKAHLLS